MPLFRKSPPPPRGRNYPNQQRQGQLFICVIDVVPIRAVVYGDIECPGSLAMFADYRSLDPFEEAVVRPLLDRVGIIPFECGLFERGVVALIL